MGSPPFLSEEVEPWGLKLVQDHSAYKGQWQRETCFCLRLKCLFLSQEISTSV